MRQIPVYVVTLGATNPILIKTMPSTILVIVEQTNDKTEIVKKVSICSVVKAHWHIGISKN